MISCLCITRGNRLPLLAQALADFAAQTHADRELLVLHDADATVHEAINTLVGQVPGGLTTQAPVRVVQVPPGLRLGGLRNAAVAQARGDWVCQWDDDDRYHPQRLALQWQAAQDQQAAACYLSDQLQWFRDDGLLYWTDWAVEPYPMNLVQGTLLARRDFMPAYPDVALGEDTLHTHALLRRAHEQRLTVARLRDRGWCYIYSFHGDNAWHRAHHEAIAQAKHRGPAKLLPSLGALPAQLAAYQPALPSLRMPVAGTWRSIVPAA